MGSNPGRRAPPWAGGQAHPRPARRHPQGRTRRGSAAALARPAAAPALRVVRHAGKLPMGFLQQLEHGLDILRERRLGSQRLQLAAFLPQHLLDERRAFNLENLILSRGEGLAAGLLGLPPAPRPRAVAVPRGGSRGARRPARMSGGATPSCAPSPARRGGRTAAEGAEPRPSADCVRAQPPQRLTGPPPIVLTRMAPPVLPVP